MRSVSWDSGVRGKKAREVGHTSATRARMGFDRWGLVFKCLLDSSGYRVVWEPLSMSIFKQDYFPQKNNKTVV